MKYLKQIILSLLVFSPLLSFASGQEIIVVAFLELIVIIVFMLIVWKLSLNWKGKFILTACFVLSTYLTHHFIETGAYYENILLTNLSLIIIPAAVVLLAFAILKNHFRNQKSNKIHSR